MSRRAPRSRNALRITRFLACLVAVTALVIGTVAPTTAVSASASQGVSADLSRAAVNGADTGIAKTTLVGFNPGNLISDAVFTSRNTMSEAQIQSFLNGKVAACRAGYVCLKDLRIATQGKGADAYCAGYTAEASESAARIIYKVAQSCGINPQVLIVMLEKEQGLVTHTWPSNWRYNAAMGQACPDTAPCDVAFAGFFAQVYGAARQMQIYMEGRYFTWYAPGKTWNILYNPSASCGSSPVYIANKATSAMYYYTPYQPNAGALAAGRGEAPCGAYGNRNFYNNFTDWFGSTQGAPSIPRPVLSSVNTSSYVVGVDSAGAVWGYPFGKSLWGDRVRLGPDLGPLKAFFGLGDLNGDGHRDYLAVDSATRVSVIYGNGTTTLSAPIDPGGSWAGVVKVEPAGDFNGDGVPDVFTTDAAGKLYLRAGDNRGGFRPPVQIGVGWGSMNLLVGGSDMNGDGKTDLVARDTAGRLFLYPGNGSGGWGAPVQIGNGWSGMTSIFSPGDFTGDGRADLLAHGANGALTLYAGRGGGFVDASGVVGNGWNALVAKGVVGPSTTKPRPLSAGLGNVDGVPGNDVFALTSAGDLRIYSGNGRGGWQMPETLFSGWSGQDRPLALGDFDGDGHSDLGRVDPSGKFFLYAGKPGGGFSNPVQIGTGWSSFVHLIGGIDFDGDRRPDVLAITTDGRMMLYRGNGSGGWAGEGAQVGNGWGVANIVINAGDFDGDGYVDLVTRLSDGTLRIYPTNGSGGFRDPKQIGNGWGIMKFVLSPGDFTGDGIPDLIGIATDGKMYLYPGNGKGGFGDRVQIGTGWGSMARIG